MRTDNVPISDKSSVSKGTRIFGEAFSLDQLAHSLFLNGTQPALDRPEVRGLGALIVNKDPVVAEHE